MLGIPAGGNLYIGLDPNGAVRGHMSYREQMEIINSLLDTAREEPGVVLAIKPHPSYGIEHLLPLIGSRRLRNVVVLPKNTPVDHFLNSIDVLVTKISTLILEAALMRRFPIAAILDGEERFKIFGDLPEVIRSKTALKELIIRLASDKAYLRGWMQEQKSRQSALLPHFYSARTNSASVSADKIIEHLH
jgi:hypothetical protein